MVECWRELDRLLRGEVTCIKELRRGKLQVSAGGMLFTIIALGVLYGLCMGSFALLQDDGGARMQMLSSAIKVPALFLLTLAVTLPSLYVSNALVGSRVSLGTVMQMLVAGMSVACAVLASLGPIVAFFSVFTSSHPFIVLLNVAVFTLSGALGLRFLFQTMRRLEQVLADARDPEPAVWATADDGSLISGAPAPARLRVCGAYGSAAAPPPVGGGFSPLDLRFCTRRRADELGFAAVHRQAGRPVHHLCPARIELLSGRLASGEGPLCLSESSFARFETQTRCSAARSPHARRAAARRLPHRWSSMG